MFKADQSYRLGLCHRLCLIVLICMTVSAVWAASPATATSFFSYAAIVVVVVIAVMAERKRSRIAPTAVSAQHIS